MSTMVTFKLVFYCMVIVAMMSHVRAGATCSSMEPICTSDGLNFPVITSGTSAESGNNYFCLASTPDPAWFYFEISMAGDIYLDLRAAQDIDFIIYGPFTSLSNAQAKCGTLGNPITEMVDCSYHPTQTETPQIPATQVGEIYVMLITNFAEIDQDISLTLAATPQSVGGTNCGIVTTTTCYDTGANNPCTAENIAQYGHHFASCNCCRFIQCDDNGRAFDMPCAGGTRWDQNLLGGPGQVHNYGECTDDGCTLSQIQLNSCGCTRYPDVGHQTGPGGLACSITNDPTMTADRCCKACEQEPTCKGWTYTEPAWGSVNCFLYDTPSDGVTYHEYCISGNPIPCIEDVNECLPTNPCQNGGTCVDGVNSYSCECRAGYTGDNCQTTVATACYDTGANNPCTAENIAQNGGSLYFESCNCCRFIQCDANGRAFDMPCAGGTRWDQDLLGGPGQVHNYGECTDDGCTLSLQAPPAVQAIANHDPLMQHIGEPKSSYYGYIMVIGVIAFILINNVFIGCWCLGKGRNKAHAKFDMVPVNDEI